MFKLLRLFLPLLIIVFVLPMFVPGPTGKPVMSPKDWLPDQSTLDKVSGVANNVIDRAGRLFSQVSGQKAGRAVEHTASQENITEGSVEIVASQKRLFGLSKKQLYKWQDESGQWHFSDDPEQAEGRSVSQQNMPDVINRLAPVEVPDIDDAEPAASADKPDFQFSPTSVPLGEIPKLIEDAKKIRNQLEQRNKKTEDI